MGIWHAGNTISNVISGLLAAAILTNMSGVRGFARWQWFVLIEGAISIAVGLGAFWLISAGGARRQLSYRPHSSQPTPYSRR